MAWKRSVGANTILESPLGVIVVEDECAPIVTVEVWTHGIGATQVTRLATREGEYAAIATGDGRLRAVVLGDRHFVQLDGRPNAGHADAFAAAFREVVERVTLHLGVRRRRYHYVPPAGWLAVPRGLATDWLAPGTPRGATQIRVAPAVPVASDTEDVLTALVAEVVGNGDTVELGERTELLAGFAIDTVMASPRGAKLWRTWALLRFGPYLCTLRLDCADHASRATNRPVFDALLASVEPVPQPNAELAAAASLLWPV
ncbi:MAG: hypothetical protein ACKV2T_34250 [Kofleriaceae bacterium]